MIGKRIVPFAFSRIALLICCLTAASQYACAAEGEAPAILQFSRKYQQQQQQLNSPVYPPGTNLGWLNMWQKNALSKSPCLSITLS
ncbi:hypothetical protein VRB95_00935 [Erwinia aphidicola]|uniref:hypothetical protein n=1 Tax=Erwinia aphidicola TaxID=68334 RepID=UPI0030D03152